MAYSKISNVFVKFLLPIIAILQIGIIYLGYSFSSKHIVNNDIAYSYPPNPLPEQGNMILFWGIMLASLIALSVTTILVFVDNKKIKKESKWPGFRKLFFLNTIPLAATIIATYITFDQLVVILLYTFYFVLLLYFRDY